MEYFIRETQYYPCIMVYGIHLKGLGNSNVYNECILIIILHINGGRLLQELALINNFPLFIHGFLRRIWCPFSEQIR